MPTTHTTPSPEDQPQPPAKPTAKQLRYLKSLAHQTGQSFTYPKTRTQASGEIRRLKAALDGIDHPLEQDAARRERRDISRDRTEQAAGAAAIRPDETTGWGSTARWA